jgi:hypothetical protein
MQKKALQYIAQMQGCSIFAFVAVVTWHWPLGVVQRQPHCKHE